MAPVNTSGYWLANMLATLPPPEKPEPLMET